MATPLEEALTSVGASALIQKRIDRTLLEYQRRYAPLVRSIPTVKWDSTVYYFNNSTTQPAGGFVTDGGARPVSSSTYNQNLYPIKLLQSVGAVTGYAQQVTADLIGNLRAREIMKAARGLYWDVETAVLWGNAASTLGGPYPQFDGFDTLVSTFSGDTQNAINFAGGAFDLGALDQLIDLVEGNVAEDVCQGDWFFVVSPTANSRLAQLFTNQQRFVDLHRAEVATGLIVPTYRNVPIVKSSFLQPRGSAMSTLTPTTSTTGGTLAAATYRYTVSAIIARSGESLPAAEVTQVTTGSTSTVTLSFTPPTGFESGAAVAYKVFRSTGGAGTTTLLGYVDANVAVASDNVTPVVTNQIVDTGATLIPQNSTGPTQPASFPATYASVGQNSSIVPLAAGEQSVYLIPKNADYLVRPYVREFTPVDVYPTTASPDSLPFATVTDTTLALRAPKYMGRLANTVVQLAS